MIQEIENEIQGLLRRAQSYGCLRFYNNEFVDVYVLAGHGFKEESDEGAVCEGCHRNIVYDTEQQMRESKQPLQADCPYRNPFILTKQKLLQFSPRLYHFLRQTHSNSTVTFDKEELDEHLPSVQELYSRLDHHYRERKMPSPSILLSCFGWVQKDDTLMCWYCGAEQPCEKVAVITAHRSWCILLRQQMWKQVMKSIVVESMQNICGEFTKTHTQKKAKQIRSNLTLHFQHILQPTLHSFTHQLRASTDEQSPYLAQTLESMQSIISQSIKQIRP